MDRSAKPTGFVKSEPEVDHHLQGVKPEPPSYLHYQRGARAGRDVGDAQNGRNTSPTDLDGFTLIERPKDNVTSTDFGVGNVLDIVKSIDVNRYATKKTIAQGMLDIALLTANASQLKYILQVGKQHEFYTLMLTLICASIALQVLQGIICVMLGSTYNINKAQDQPKANVWNNVTLALMVLTVAVNVIISAFDMRYTDPVEPSSDPGDHGQTSSTVGI